MPEAPLERDRKLNIMEEMMRVLATRENGKLNPGFNQKDLNFGNVPMSGEVKKAEKSS